MEKTYSQPIEEQYEIKRSWTLVAFAKEHGMPKAALCNAGTTDEHESLLFADNTWVRFGPSVAFLAKGNPEATAQAIGEKGKSLKVGENGNGKFILFDDNSEKLCSISFD